MAHQVLWTGGWDSTFRVLDLVLHRGATVQPHYLVFHPSASYELAAMDSIRAGLGAAAERILPTRTIELANVRRDPRIADRYQRIRRLYYLGDQYQFLAEYADQYDVHDLELSIHRDDKAREALQPAVSRVEDDCGGYYRFDPSTGYPGELFERFRFPLFDLTKLEMRELAQERGFSELLKLTWFCYTPVDGQPCGQCNPCQYTMGEGLAERIPSGRRGKPPWTRRMRVFARDSVTRLARFRRQLLGS